MAINTGAEGEAHNAQKRPHEDSSSNGDEKRVKTEYTHDDPTLDNLFAPLPFETKEGPSSEGFLIDGAPDLELPDFLTENPAATASVEASNQGMPQSVPDQSIPLTPNASGLNQLHTLKQHEKQAVSSLSPIVTNNGQLSETYPPHASALSRVNSSGQLTEHAQTGNLSGSGPSPLYQPHAQLGIASTHQFQKTPTASFPHQYRPQGSNVAASPSTVKSGIRFDPSKSFPLQASQSSPMVPMAGSSTVAQHGANPNILDKDKLEDPSKLNDALAAAGVDIEREEELLSTNYNRSALNIHQQQLANRQRQAYGQLNSFLHPYHLALFMNRVARDNGVLQNFMVDTEMMEFMSSACKEWLSHIITKTVALAKHRRRGIPAFNPKNKVTGKQKATPPSQRSEVSKELRNLALRQKELEERRVAKRALLGLEKSDEVAPDSANKAGAEETLHRAANATAAMMTMNSSRKKYSWMTSGSGNTAEEGKGNGNKDNSKQSTLISSRGDNGLRFRDIRTGNMISSKDLLGVLEDEHIGTTKAVIKGYARLKD